MLRSSVAAFLCVATLTAVTESSAARKKGGDPALEEVEEQIDLGTADVLERLKLLRVQMALDREEIAALRLRIEKIQLQREFEALLSTGQDEAPGDVRPRARRAVDPTQNILVKAITLQPRKEAIILFRGRIFNVRPGDNIGGIVIKDITEGGLKIQRSKSGASVIK